MEVSASMKTVVCLLLLLHCTAVSASHTVCSNEGEIEIIGTVTPTLIAGRLEICVQGEWRAVYHGSWGDDEVEIVCRGRGFPADGTSD